MKLVIAPDSFKECAAAAHVAARIAEGVRRAVPDAEVAEVPMADGGEGTVDAMVAASGGHYVTCEVTGPLGNKVQAQYGVLGHHGTAVIEMAAASGLALVPPRRRDPRRATTRGTGELMRDALERGVRRLILGIGGSATNDGGAGMAQALGYRFLDEAGEELPPGGAALARLATIDASGRHPSLDALEVHVACDVDNPLCGPRGASAVYGPQKGATEEMVAELDAALNHFAAIIRTQLGIEVAYIPGAGAAGGLGAGLLAFARGTLRPGVELVAEFVGLPERLSGADLVFTGEGALDAQTLHGKTPVGVAQLALAANVPVIALAGRLGPGYRELYHHGITAAFALTDGPMDTATAIARFDELIADRAEAVLRLWLALPRGR